MPWQMVTRGDSNVTLKEAVEGIKKRKEEGRLVSKFENEHRDEINEILGSIECIDEKYLEKSYPEIYNFGPGRLDMHFEDKFVLTEYSSDSPSNQGYSQLDYFEKVIKAYQDQDADADKYVERGKAFIDKPLDELGVEDVSAIREKKFVKFPCRLEIPMFYELTGRLREELEFNERDLIIHFYITFMAASKKLFRKPVRCRVNVLYHLLKKNIGKEPNADLFPFMKGDSHQRTEEEIKFVFDHLGWSYSPIPLGTRGLPWLTLTLSLGTSKHQIILNGV